MKTLEQNRKEVMNYLKRSSKNFFLSEDGQHWQSIVKIHTLDQYVFIRDGKVFPIEVEKYCQASITAGKTFLKQKTHPQYDPNHLYKYSERMGHGPSKKLCAVRWNKERLELTSKAVKEYLK